MRYLVDTDWAVWWLRGGPDVVQRLRTLRTEGLAISAVTLGELVTGRWQAELRNGSLCHRGPPTQSATRAGLV